MGRTEQDPWGDRRSGTRSACSFGCLDSYRRTATQGEIRLRRHPNQLIPLDKNPVARLPAIGITYTLSRVRQVSLFPNLHRDVSGERRVWSEDTVGDPIDPWSDLGDQHVVGVGNVESDVGDAYIPVGR